MLPVLFDEMYEGKDEELKKLGYDAYSVRKLREEKKLKLQYDYSIIKYAELNKMILITEDTENKAYPRSKLHAKTPQAKLRKFFSRLIFEHFVKLEKSSTS
ncbi:hypothetical protein LCGC14_2358810 [marine sediment metagenome]|uniref:DUF5615 domain-containing protein n=1 Tax=marine sediment metagenome TaxID=412755 RepID=A0A0F9EJP0_9ZZZZ